MGHSNGAIRAAALVTEMGGEFSSSDVWPEGASFTFAVPVSLAGVVMLAPSAVNNVVPLEDMAIVPPLTGPVLPFSDVPLLVIDGGEDRTTRDQGQMFIEMLEVSMPAGLTSDLTAFALVPEANHQSWHSRWEQVGREALLIEPEVQQALLAELLTRFVQEVTTPGSISPLTELARSLGGPTVAGYDVDRVMWSHLGRDDTLLDETFSGPTNALGGVNAFSGVNANPGSGRVRVTWSSPGGGMALPFSMRHFTDSAQREVVLRIRGLLPQMMPQRLGVVADGVLWDYPLAEYELLTTQYVSPFDGEVRAPYVDVRMPVACMAAESGGLGDPEDGFDGVRWSSGLDPVGSWVLDTAFVSERGL
jgi:hypothetical protein